MMKKILSLILVLAIGSVASADSVWLEVDETDAADGYAPSSFITINLVSDVLVTGIGQLSFGTDNGGTASDPSLHQNITAGVVSAGTLVNSGGTLMHSISGLTGTSLPPTVFVGIGEVIYSFEFHVPELDYSTWIVIDDLTGVVPGGAPFPVTTSVNTFIAAGEIYGTLTDVGALEIHVPEPATICLLGIGALSLIRRRRKTA